MNRTRSGHRSERVAQSTVPPSPLAQLRERRGWTQEKLAERSGVDVRTIRRIEGEARKPSLSTKSGLAHALEMSVETLTDLLEPCSVETPDGFLATSEHYRNAFIESARARSEPYVPLNTRNQEDVRSKIVATAISGRHACILGVSGAGKSYALLAAGRSLGERETIPILARCRLFTGSPYDWLDAATSTYGCPSFAALISSARAADNRIVFLLDGANELAADAVDIVLEVVQGIALCHGASIIVSAQKPLDKWMTALRLEPVEVGLPSDAEKNQLVSALGLDLTGAQAHVLAALRTPMDVTLAVHAWKRRQEPGSRFSLLHDFALERLSGIDDSQLCHRALRQVASMLTDRVSRTMGQDEFSRVVEQNASPRAVEDVLRSSLCEAEQGLVGFAHDFIQDYFAAQFILYGSDDATRIAKTLERPVFSRLADLALEAQATPRDVRSLFGSCLPIRELATSALLGYHGHVAQDGVLEEARMLVASAVATLSGTHIADDRGVPAMRIFSSWSNKQTELLQALGSACFAAKPRSLLLELFAAADQWVVENASGASSPDAAYEALCHFSGNTPVSNVLMSVRSITAFGVQTDDYAVGRPSGTPGCSPVTWLFWAHLNAIRFRSRWLYGELSEAGQEEAVSFVDLLISSGFRMLATEAFELADDLAGSLAPGPRERMKRVLRHAKAQDAFSSTFLIDALDAYGMIESAYDVDELLQELLEIVSRPDDPVSQRRAHHAYAAQIESASVINGPHIEAIGALSERDGIVLRAMAVLGAHQQGSSHAVDMCLRDLGQQPAARNVALAVRAVEVWSQKVPALSFMPQDDVRCFVRAHQCIAALQLTRPVPHTAEPLERAWAALGFLVSFDPTAGSAIGQRSWAALTAELLPFAIVPVLWILNVEHVYKARGLRPWRTELLSFLRAALEDPRGLPLDTRGPGLRSVVQVIAEHLGELGDTTDVQRLRRLASDPESGPAAVASIRRLLARNTSSGTSAG